MVMATMMMSEFLIRWDGGIQGWYPLATPTRRDRRPQATCWAGLLRSCQTPGALARLL